MKVSSSLFLLDSNLNLAGKNRTLYTLEGSSETGYLVSSWMNRREGSKSVEGFKFRRKDEMKEEILQLRSFFFFLSDESKED
jgi:hypothetical protein